MTNKFLTAKQIFCDYHHDVTLQFKETVETD